MATVNLKLPNEKHAEFLKAVKDSGETMQSVLSAFVASYIESPKQFTIKMEVISNGNNGSSG